MTESEDPFEWDSAKNCSNAEKHGVPLSAAVQFDFSSAFIVADTRKDYGEPRLNAYGYDVEGHAMTLCFTVRDEKIRFISYRRMNQREQAKFL